ncbi:MAG: hypothetical protein COB41_00360 [Proteobacteria bacterium]|nr:MAG: hypothetical protein COB41_00360 [Pseudomonadota bacterium]
MTKLIIAGGRDLNLSVGIVISVLGLHNICPDEVVCGMASGIDALGKQFANIKDIKVIEFPAKWKEHGRAAGPIRNKQMAEYGTALLLIWDGVSRGSASMKKEMEKLGKPVYEVILKG